MGRKFEMPIFMLSLRAFGIIDKKSYVLYIKEDMPGWHILFSSFTEGGACSALYLGDCM